MNNIHRMIALAAFILVLSAAVHFILMMISIGPGLPGPEGMLDWYVPKNLKNKESDPYPYFPAVSQYSVSLNYTSKTRMTIWYFEELDDLEKGEKELCMHLKEHGNVSSDTLIIPVEVQDDNSETASPLKNFSVTRYENKETSGYFEVIKNPFGGGVDGYFILYYGNNGKSLEEENNRIKNTMVKEYYRKNEGGDIRRLNACITDQSI